MICQVTFALFCLQGYCTVAGGQGDGGIGAGRSPEYREGGSARVGHIGRCLHLDVGNGACAGIKRETEADDGHLTGAHLIWKPHVQALLIRYRTSTSTFSKCFLFCR